MRARGPALRAVPWWPVLAAVAVAMAIVALLGREPGLLMESVRWGAVALALGVAGVLDDPSAELHASLPTPDRRVRLRALAIAAPVLVSGWAALVWVGDRSSLVGARVAEAFDRCLELAAPGLALEAVAILAVTLAAAAVVARRNPGVGAALAGGTFGVLAYAGRLSLPDGLELAVGPLDPRWQPALARWALLLVVAVALLLHLTADRWRRPRPLRRGAAWLVVGLAVLGLSVMTTRPRPLPATFDAMVADQELASAELSVGGQVPFEARRGGPAGELDVLRVTVVGPGRTGSVQLPVTGTVTATGLRAWVSSVPPVTDDEVLAELVATRPPHGLEVRDPGAPARSRTVGEVLVDHRSGTTVASVAAPGDRTCGVALARQVHAWLAR